MPFAIITTTNARRDLQQAIEWENMRKPGLAAHFLNDLEKKLDLLSITPGMGSIRYEMFTSPILKYFLTIFIILLMRHCNKLRY